jgi:hypothetical protein
VRSLPSRARLRAERSGSAASGKRGVFCGSLLPQVDRQPFLLGPTTVFLGPTYAPAVGQERSIANVGFDAIKRQECSNQPKAREHAAKASPTVVARPDHTVHSSCCSCRWYPASRLPARNSSSRDVTTSDCIAARSSSCAWSPLSTPACCRSSASSAWADAQRNCSKAVTRPAWSARPWAFVGTNASSRARMAAGQLRSLTSSTVTITASYKASSASS